MCVYVLCRVGLCDRMNCSLQAPLSIRFPRQDPPGDLHDTGIEPMSPLSPALAGGFFTTESLGKLIGKQTLVRLVFLSQFHHNAI